MNGCFGSLSDTQRQLAVKASRGFTIKLISCFIVFAHLEGVFFSANIVPVAIIGGATSL